ncbi:MAG: hypothetical protein KDD33_01085 [Bdellovibrionales bacterium]|nr:hypothetical protein [Bdellovibrionales bacterium]
MKKLLLSFILLISPLAHGDNLLDVLDGKADSDGLAVVKKESLLNALIPYPTAEQNIFLGFMNEQKFDKALFQWPSAFSGTSFANSANGRALYGYLLYKNGLEVVGVETLFEAKPTQVNKRLMRLWQGLMQENEDLWTYTNVQWNSQWTDVFGVAAEVTILSRRFDKNLPAAQWEALLRKTTKGTWERNWSEWQYVTSLISEGEDVKAAKLLKHLQTVTENNPVSQNLMNLTAARLLYQNGFLNDAIKYYGKVEKKSDYWFEAQEEIGWSYIRLGQPQNTLAISQTLLAKDFTADVGPETFYLTSLAQLKTCDYTELSKLLKEFRNRFQSKAQRMLLMQKTPESQATRKLFSLLKESRTQMPALGAYGSEVPRYSTRDESLFYLVQREKKLAHEADVARKLYSSSLSGGTAQVGFQAKMEKFKKAIESRARVSYTAALGRMQELAKQEVQEIGDILKKMQIVEAELIQQLAMAERVIEDTQGKTASVKKGSTGSQAKDTVQFPFEGEVWFDELSNYRVDIAKGCQSGKEKKL